MGGADRESPAATRAVAETFIETTIVEGTTRTEKNMAPERPGAWALLGRAEDETAMEPRTSEKSSCVEERAREWCAAPGAKRWGAGLDDTVLTRR